MTGVNVWWVEKHSSCNCLDTWKYSYIIIIQISRCCDNQSHIHFNRARRWLDHTVWSMPLCVWVWARMEGAGVCWWGGGGGGRGPECRTEEPSNSKNGSRLLMTQLIVSFEAERRVVEARGSNSNLPPVYSRVILPAVPSWPWPTSVLGCCQRHWVWYVGLCRVLW